MVTCAPRKLWADAAREAAAARGGGLTEVGYGAAMVQMPRPCVAAMSVPLGSTVSWSTTTFGRFVPGLLQVAPLSDDVNTPKSDATMRWPFSKTTSSIGPSGRLPETSVQLVPPFVVSKTWPTPGSSGPIIQWRE